ncbi:MAG TPA: hypothetical protein VFQ60_05170, partial [Patescibacteria group bacterium]|nr:hypothetical protein [Patescibacteria group bacterium]
MRKTSIPLWPFFLLGGVVLGLFVGLAAVFFLSAKPSTTPEPPPVSQNWDVNWLAVPTKISAEETLRVLSLNASTTAQKAAIKKLADLSTIYRTGTIQNGPYKGGRMYVWTLAVEDLSNEMMPTSTYTVRLAATNNGVAVLATKRAGADWLNNLHPELATLLPVVN